MMRHRLLGVALTLGLVGCTVRPGSLVSVPSSTGAPVASGQTDPAAGQAQEPVSEYGNLTLTIRWPERPSGYQTALIPTSANTLVIKVASGSTVVATTTIQRDSSEVTTTANLPVKAGNNLNVEVLAYREVAPLPQDATHIARGTANVNIVRSQKTKGNVSLVPVNVPTITGLSVNAGVPGDTVTITGTNFGTGSVPVVVYFNGYITGASRTSETSLTVTVPPGTPTGKVVVKADGVSSESNMVFWVPKTVSVSTVYDAWDPSYPSGQIVLLGKSKQLTASTTWETKANETAEQYGTPPAPSWSSSDPTAGTLSDEGIFTAGSSYVAAGTNVRASYGSMSSAAFKMIPEAVTFSLHVPSERVLGGKGKASLDFYGVNTFSDGSTNSMVTYSEAGSPMASASIDWYTRKAVAIDFGSNGKIAVLAESQIDPSLKATSDITLSNYAVTTLAGNGFSGWINGTGTDAQFSGARGITQGPTGDFYVADGNYIRKVTKAGEVTTVGSNGSAYSVAAASDGALYVADSTFHVIRKFQGGSDTVLAGSTAFAQGGTDAVGTAARFNMPYAVALDASRNLLYVADYGNNRIRKIDLITQAVSTLAGSTGDTPAGYIDAAGTAAKFNGPHSLAVDSQGNVLVADLNNHVIRKVTPAGVVSTLATGFNYPAGVAVDAQDNVYVAEIWGHKVRKIHTTGEIITLAGTGTAGFASGIGTKATLNAPISLAVDPSGDVYVLVNGSYAVRVLK